MPGESCENANTSLSRRMSVNGEKLAKREKTRELIFPSNYDLLRHLQYATHFPIPLVSHGFVGVSCDDFIIRSLVIAWQVTHRLLCLHVVMPGECRVCRSDGYSLDRIASAQTQLGNDGVRCQWLPRLDFPIAISSQQKHLSHCTWSLNVFPTLI